MTRIRKAFVVALIGMLIVPAGALLIGPVAATHGDTSGTITDSSTGSYVVGATVTAYDGAGAEVANATTDSNGQYSMHLANDTYDIEVVADGYKTDMQSVTVADATTHSVALIGRVELHNSTVAIDNDTQEVYADVLNTSADPVDVSFYGIDNGTETFIETVTVSAAYGEVVEANTSADPSLYDSYRVVVEADDGVTAEDITVGTVAKLSGGGGGGSGSLGDIDFSKEYLGIPLWLHLVVGSSVAGVALRYNSQ